MKINKNLFTKAKINNIMKTNYNPFNKREGLFMDNIILKELEDGLNWRKRILVKLLKKQFIEAYKSGVKKGFNLSN